MKYKNRIYFFSIALLCMLMNALLIGDTSLPKESSSLYNEFSTAHINSLLHEEIYASLNGMDASDLGKKHTKNERLKRAYINESKRAMSSVEPTQTDIATWHEIGIKELAEKIDPQLLSGKAALTRLLCTPTTDSAYITANQDKQKLLEEDEELAKDIELLLNNAYKGEKSLFHLWNRDKEYHARAITNSYVRDIPVIRDSATAITMASWLPAALPTAMAIGNVTGAVLSNNNMTLRAELSEINTSTKCALPDDSIKLDEIKDLIRELNKKILIIPPGQKAAYTFSIMGFMSVSSDLAEMLRSPIKSSLHSVPFVIALATPTLLSEKQSYGVAGLCYAASTLYSLYETYQKRTSPAEIALHQSLINAAHYMRSAEKIYTLMQHNTKLKSQFPDFCSTYEQLRDNKNTQSIVHDLLHTNTFTGEPSIFSNIGRIALVHNRISQEKDAFIPLMLQMGQINIFAALVNYKKAHPGTFVYTKPQSTTGHAFVDAEQFVHPARPDSIANSLLFGGISQPKVILIEGPNECGKSSLKKALSANIVTSHTAGFAASKAFSLSPFNDIRFIANTADSADESRGRAELQKIQETLLAVYKASSNKQSIVVFHDEALSGMDRDAASEGITMIVDDITSTPDNNSLIAFTSHHKIDLTNNPHVQSYHVSMHDKYRLKPGRSNESNGAYLVKQAIKNVKTTFEKWLIEKKTTN